MTPFPHMNLSTNSDAERFLLGAVIRDNRPLPATLAPEDFGEPWLQDVAYAINALKVDGTDLDELTVLDALTKAGSPVTREAVNGLTNDVGFSAYNAAWAEQVATAASLRRIAALNLRIAKAVADPGTDPAALAAYAEQQLKALAGKPKEAPEDKTTEYFDLDAMLNFDPAADPTVLIGADRRWICQGYPFQIVGFSGTGKSSLAVHLAVHWALGKSPFGLKPVRALKVLVVQGENDIGDASESLMGATEKLIEPEKALLRQNLIFVRQSTKVGFEFVSYLGDMIRKHGIDLAIIDPLLQYANFDIADQAATSAFLRGPGGIHEMLQQTKAALLYMHHTTKPKSSEDLDTLTPQQLAYLGAGCAEWTNFSRDAGYLFRTAATANGRPVYKFGFSKRQFRAGLVNALGQPAYSGHVLLQHAEGGRVRWEYAATTEDAQPDANPSPAKGSGRRFI